MKFGLGVGGRPDVMGLQIVHLLLLGNLQHFFGLRPVAEGDVAVVEGPLQQLTQSRPVGRLQQVFLLVQVGGIEQKLPVNNTEVLAVFMDSAFAQQENLFSLGHGFDGNRPLFQGHLATVG